MLLDSSENSIFGYICITTLKKILFPFSSGFVHQKQRWRIFSPRELGLVRASYPGNYCLRLLILIITYKSLLTAAKGIIGNWAEELKAEEDPKSRQGA